MNNNKNSILYKDLSYKIIGLAMEVHTHKAKALNYLKATGLRLVIIINFGKEELENRRVVL